VSENSESICRYAPRNLLDIQDFSQIFPPDQRLLFHSKALDVRYHFRQKLESDEPVVLSVKFWDTDRALIPAWCAMHFVGGDHNLLICEFEPDHHPEDFIPSSHLPSTPIDSMLYGMKYKCAC
jgi:hypothetical protein